MSGRVGLEECDATKLVDVLSALETTRAEGVNVRAECAIYVLTNITVNGLETFIDFHALRDGVDVSVQIAPFNVLHQELVSETSQLHATKPNLLVLALGWEGFAGRFDIVPDDVVSRLEGLFDLAASKSAATIAVNTFVLPSAPTERAPAAGSVSGTIQAVNDWIRDYVRAHRDRFFLCDWGGYVQDIGRAQALDSRYALMAKAPFRPAFLTRYAADLARISCALLGLNKKVLVLDCDNTLWGGVLGEDGPDGIKLDPDDYPRQRLLCGAERVFGYRTAWRCPGDLLEKQRSRCARSDAYTSALSDAAKRLCNNADQLGKQSRKHSSAGRRAKLGARQFCLCR